jgi:16S rRNA (adenine1518-N6/adenine1519-N6)-dimethyltransferase
LPRKLGQHFLVRDSILERLAKAACPTPTARVIEIGPGRGALTRHLLPRTDELHAIELDSSLVQYLRTAFASEPKLHLHECDVLKTDLSQWGGAVVAGNLPYYITSPTIEKFLDLDGQFPAAVFLVQWEVAQRLLAKPGSRDYAYLTVSAQLRCDVELVCRVPPAAFSPPPKVDSAAVRLVRKQQVQENLRPLLSFVGRSFAQKRKTLRNNLRQFYGPLVDDLPEARLRAEQLSLAQFVDLYQRLSRAAGHQ